MSRLIDKDELMKALNISYSCSNCDYEHGAFCRNSRDFVDACEIICNAPTVTQWIPCSEKLPEEKGEHLVTYHPCYWDSVSPETKVGIDTFLGKTSWAKKKYQRVIAWMPLPEPYKEET